MRRAILFIFIVNHLYTTAQQLVKNPGFEDFYACGLSPADSCGYNNTGCGMWDYQTLAAFDSMNMGKGVYMSSFNIPPPPPYILNNLIRNTRVFKINIPSCNNFWPIPQGDVCLLFSTGSRNRPATAGVSINMPHFALKQALVPNHHYLFKGYFHFNRGSGPDVNHVLSIGTTNMVDTNIHELFRTTIKGEQRNSLPLLFPNDLNGWHIMSTALQATHADTLLSLRVYVNDSAVQLNINLDYITLYPMQSFPSRRVSMCKGDSLLLMASKTGLSYNWSTGRFQDTLPALMAKTAGWYIANIYTQDSAYVDSIEVVYTETIAQIQTTQISVCTDSIQLGHTQTPANAAALWNTGQTTRVISIQTPGTYWRVMQAPLGCRYVDTFLVNQVYPPAIQVSSSGTFCPGDSAQVQVDTSYYYSFIWSNGKTGSSVYATDTGFIQVIATNGYCTTIDSIQLSYTDTLIYQQTMDTSICSYPILLTAGLPKVINHVLWSTGENTLTKTVQQAGKYWRQINTTACRYIDTFHVMQDIAPPLTLPNDTGFCLGGKVMIFANGPLYQSFIWNNGSTGHALLVADSGTYVLYADNGYCRNTDSIHVGIIPSPALTVPKDTMICMDKELEINVSNAYYQQYQWSTGETGPQIKINQSGNYTVRATNEQTKCYTEATINLKIHALPEVKLPPDTVLCFKELEAYLIDAGQWKSYYWYPTGETTQTIEAIKAAQYKVVITDSNNCTGTDDVLITEECPEGIYIPNAFTPDANGVNDVFEPKGRYIQSYHMQIINRWGQVVYTGHKAWNGTIQNQPAEAGVYTYVMEIKIGTQTETRKGTLTLMR